MSEPMDLIYKDPKYPSSKVVNGLSMAGPRAHLRGMGLVNEELAKPFIGVINTYNEMHPGHIHLNRIGQLVKDGVREAGGVPFEVNTISLCDGFSQGHVGMCSVLPSREVIADSIEVYAGGHQLDGLVLIGGCDKIVPAMIMAALRINLPTVLVTGGPMMPAVYKGKQYGTYELKEMAGKLTRGEISREEYEYMEGLMSPTPGSCAMMGTANTMSIIAEAMGLQVNAGKSKVVPFSRPFRFCKAKFQVTNTGAVKIHGCRDGMKRARRKLRLFQARVASGEMTVEQVAQWLQTPISYYENFNDHGRVLKLRRLFYAIFKTEV